MTDNTNINMEVASDLSYAKLSMYDGSSSIKIWLNSADRCIDIKGLKGDSAVSYVLYHLTGQARIYVLMLGDDLTKLEKIRAALCDRFEFETIVSIVYKWEGAVVESIRKNVKSNELRSSLINQKELSFKGIREHIRKWDMVEDEVSFYVVNKPTESRKDNIELNRISGSDMSRGVYGEYRSRGYSNTSRGIADG